MITKKQFKIFDVFVSSPFQEHTRKEIKEKTKEKSNNKLNSTINLLKKEEIVNERLVGKSGLLTLNLNNNLSYFYMGVSNHNKLSKCVETILEQVNQEISKLTSFYSIVIFGSYANNTFTKSSDLDLAIFVDDDLKIKKIIASMNSLNLKLSMKVDFQIISKKEMLDMILSDEENLGKEIARKHIAVCNIKIFYDILKEGINYGFRI